MFQMGFVFRDVSIHCIICCLSSRKFGRLCSLRGIGLFPEEYQQLSYENSSEVTAALKGTYEHENESEKVYPQPSDEKIPKTEALETLISELFANISASKAAYAQLQVAHMPYDQVRK